MFHAFQYDTLKDVEFPNDLKLLQYPDDEENYLIKQNEDELLAESADADPKRKAEILRTILASRALRELKCSSGGSDREVRRSGRVFGNAGP